MKARPVLASLPLSAVDAIRAIGSPTAGSDAKYSQCNEEEAESKHTFSFLFIAICHFLHMVYYVRSYAYMSRLIAAHM